MNLDCSNPTLEIEFKPIYTGYMLSKYRSDETEPEAISLKKAKELKILFTGLLRKQPLSPVQHSSSLKGEVKRCRFILPYSEDYNARYYTYISPSGEKIIRGWVRSCFYFDLHSYIRDMTNSGFSEIKALIISFCDSHNIDPSDYNYDSLKREYYRYRQRQKKDNKRENITTSFRAI